MSDVNKPPSAQEKAIHDYLESLLVELPDEAQEPQQAAPQVDTAVDIETVIDEPVEQHTKPLTVPAVIGLEQLVAEIPEVITEIVTDTKLETATELEVPVMVDESGVPDWAQTRFQCLLFKVSGLSLAVPLVKLNSVIPWNENIAITPNQTEWYLGLIQHLQKQVKVIDTALLVMPENRHELLEAESDKRLSHILLVDDYQWGLACDSIGDVIWLTKDEVKWRKNKNTRKWLSGTSLEHLCAVIDTEVFAQMLNKTA